MSIKKLLIRLVVPTGLPLLSLFCFIILESFLLGYGFLFLGVLFIWRKLKFDGYAHARCILLFSAWYAGAELISDGLNQWLFALSVMGLIGIITQEKVVKRAVRGRYLEYSNLTVDYSIADKVIRMASRGYLNAMSLVLIVLASTSFFPAWIAFWFVIAYALLLACALYLLYQYRRYNQYLSDGNVVKSIDETKPVFALYLSGPPNASFHSIMWLPYLDKVGLTYFVIVREPRHIAPLKKHTDSAIVCALAIPHVESLLVDSLKAVFYVNNGMKNTHLVKYRGLKHIQLLHGDSDKVSSFNPITKMYDFVFVAGKAGIDRYEKNGVVIPKENFVIVGRPQVSDIQVRNEVKLNLSEMTVMYAPTWAGYASDANYSSLRIGCRIIKDLLSLNVKIIFRTHPFARKYPVTATFIKQCEALLMEDNAVSKSSHVFGDDAEKVLLSECFNKSDILISDVSSIASDWLFSEKPFLITDMYDEGDGMKVSFPLSDVAYKVNSNGENIIEVMNEIVMSDHLKNGRISMKKYYLGDFEEDTYENGFINAARTICLKT